MANLTTDKFITLSNLTKYDELIKSYVDTEDAKAFKSLAVVGDYIYFFKEVPVPMNGTDVDTSKAAYSVKISSSDVTQLLADVEEIQATLSGYDKDHTVATAVADAKKAGTDAADAVTTLENGQVKTNKEAIEAINNATTGILATAKSYTDTEIQKLDGNVTGTGKFATAVSQEDGVVSATMVDLVADDIPNLTLAKITDAGTVASKDVATVAIGSDGEATTAIPTVGQVESYVSTQIADLEGAMHFVGVITRNEGETDEQAITRVVAAPKPGDVVVMSDNAKEYIFVDPDPETEGDEAWREVGDEGLYVQKATTIAGVDLQDNITKDELLTALNVADGAQVNVLEGVQVNGADLAITNKKVNVTVAEGATNGTVAVNGTDVAVHGLGSAAYTDSTAYATADQGALADSAVQADDIVIATEAEIIALFSAE